MNPEDYVNDFFTDNILSPIQDSIDFNGSEFRSVFINSSQSENLLLTHSAFYTSNSDSTMVTSPIFHDSIQPISSSSLSSENANSWPHTPVNIDAPSFIPQTPISERSPHNNSSSHSLFPSSSIQSPSSESHLRFEPSTHCPSTDGDRIEQSSAESSSKALESSASASIEHQDLVSTFETPLEDSSDNSSEEDENDDAADIVVIESSSTDSRSNSVSSSGSDSEDEDEDDEESWDACTSSKKRKRCGSNSSKKKTNYGGPLKKANWFSCLLTPFKNSGDEIPISKQLLSDKLMEFSDRFVLGWKELCSATKKTSNMIKSSTTVSTSSSSIATTTTTVSAKEPNELNLFLRADGKYAIKVLLGFDQKIDTADVSRFFVRFLHSLNPSLSKKDPLFLRSENSTKRIELESVDDSKRELSKITTDPDALFFDFNPLKFNLFYRAVDWARRTPVWSDYEHFVISNNNNKGQIRRIHEAVQKSLLVKPTIKLFPTSPRFNDWRDDCVVWWNNYVRDGYSDKMPQLYIHGPSNAGKTTFIKQLLKNSNIGDDFIHCLPNQDTNTERFMFADFKPDQHYICIWEEFRLPKSLKTFKQIVAGETACTDRKNEATSKVAFRVPIIMTSNTSFKEMMRECNYEPGVKERLLPVEAKSKPFKVKRKSQIEKEIANLKRKK